MAKLYRVNVHAPDGCHLYVVKGFLEEEVQALGSVQVGFARTGVPSQSDSTPSSTSIIDHGIVSSSSSCPCSSMQETSGILLTFTSMLVLRCLLRGIGNSGSDVRLPVGTVDVGAA